ncbi:MAG: hypothetical protein KF812_05555, partial [Fimbriimonadaceae bacterium]|nr:hypothetical protein [Fimbriimonadaceae bacterium]
MAYEKLREKIAEDIATGRLGIARDRLRALLREVPNDLTVRDELGEVNLRLGYPVEAGRWWFLVPDPDERKQEAIRQFVESCNSNVAEILRKLELPEGSGQFTDEE